MRRIYRFTKYQEHSFFMSWIILIKSKASKNFRKSFILLFNIAQKYYFSSICGNT